MKTCITCGMPLSEDGIHDTGLMMAEGPVCIHDSTDGKMKVPQEIFEGGVGFFLSSVTPGDRSLAERITRKNMKSLPYWQAHPFAELEGSEASDEEFAEAMKKL